MVKLFTALVAQESRFVLVIKQGRTCCSEDLLVWFGFGLGVHEDSLHIASQHWCLIPLGFGLGLGLGVHEALSFSSLWENCYVGGNLSFTGLEACFLSKHDLFGCLDYYWYWRGPGSSAKAFGVPACWWLLRGLSLSVYLGESLCLSTTLVPVATTLLILVTWHCSCNMISWEVFSGTPPSSIDIQAGLYRSALQNSFVKVVLL